MKFNAKKARELVEASPIKEKVLADACIIKLKTLQHYLRGDGEPSPQVLRLLAHALQVQEEALTCPESETQKAG